MTNTVMNLMKRSRLTSGAVLFLVALSLVAGCKDEDLIGLEVQPEGQQLGLVSTDTFTLETYTEVIDSVRSDETTTNLLGTLTDPDFGTSRANFYVQFRLEQENLDFGDLSDIELDSVTVSFRHFSLYGDSADPQTFRVYEMSGSEEWELDSAYFSNQTFETSPTPIGELTNYVANTVDSVSVGDGREPAQLRIKLNNDFGQKLLDGAADNSYTDNESFIEFFKGLEVRAETAGQAAGDGAIFSFDMVSSISRMTIYYTQKSTGNQFDFNFLINTLSPRLNTFQHEYTGFPVDNYLADKGLGDRLFLQSLSGTRGVIKMPTLEKLVTDVGDDPVLINRAELVIPIDETNMADYDLPGSLTLIALNSDGNEIFVIDQFVSDSHIGGDLDESNNDYRFRITRHVQTLIDQYRAGETPINELRLITTGNAVNPNRVVLNGADNTTEAFRLILSYTPIN